MDVHSCIKGFCNESHVYIADAYKCIRIPFYNMENICTLQIIKLDTLIVG